MSKGKTAHHAQVLQKQQLVLFICQVFIGCSLIERQGVGFPLIFSVLL
jgi:hypothetical protein